MYFALTSMYCLLAFLPYTYCSFIKAPPYLWMPLFVQHQAGLYWLSAAAAVIANWGAGSWAKRDRRLLAGVGLIAAAGTYLTLRPFLPGLKDDPAAYWWSLAALLALAGVALWKPFHTQSNSARPVVASQGADKCGRLFGYSTGLLTAMAVSLIYITGSLWQEHGETAKHGLERADAELALWSLVSHCAVAIVILSALNLVYLAAAKTTRPGLVRRTLGGILVVAALWRALSHFLNTALSFDGWGAGAYAVSFAVVLTLWGFSLVSPLLRSRQTFSDQGPETEIRPSSQRTAALWAVIAILTAVAVTFRSLIGGGDWSGILGGTWALVFWITMSLCIHQLRPARKSYSIAVVVGTMLVAAFVYKGLQATEIFWGKPLGSTDDEISLKFEDYGGRDASFQLAHHVLGNGRPQNCGDLCRILREYTNVRDNQIHAEVRLVEHLTSTQGETPNIFMFVIDSMRPDYLGAYNPAQVTYTPHLDALARDSVVFTNVYTQYAGTSLSEPAIWAGALLLHAHYPEPFEKVDSLVKMTRADHYQMVASTDEMLNQVLPPAEDVTLLDTDKKLWNQLEICSTVQQAESYLDGHTSNQPVLLYTQPKNVHQFARNDVPSPTSQHWQSPDGLNPRITYEVHWVDSCLGNFFDYLKKRGMYDNSIIIVTSDHGDATGEFGRNSHSTSIWPEIMKVPLIVHLPPKMRQQVVFDTGRLSTLTDIVPSLYYLLGHRPIRENPLYGRPLFAETKKELESYPTRDLLLASDVKAVYGILTADGRYLYVTYDSPAQSYLFDLVNDSNAERDILTPALKQRYDEEIIEHLHMIGDYYGYKPGVGSLLASAGR
jgi:hypothetical protein